MTEGEAPRSPSDLLAAADLLRTEAVASVEAAAKVLAKRKDGIEMAKEDLKVAVNAAVKLAIDKTDIAKAAGVSESTVSAWTRTEKSDG